MKALLCKQYGAPENLVLEDIPRPSAGPNQVVLDVKACGINFYDSLIVQGGIRSSRRCLSPRAAKSPGW